MHDRPSRGIDYWVPGTPKGSEPESKPRSVSDYQSGFFTSPADFPQRTYNTCCKSAFYYFRGLLLLSLSVGATAGSCLTGKKITDTDDKGYIAATVSLAFVAVVTLAFTIRHFSVNKKPEVTDFQDEDNRFGYRRLNS